MPQPSQASPPSQPPMAHPLAASSPVTPPSVEASAWRRVELAPGVELHIRADAETRYRALIERTLRASRDDWETSGEQDE